MGATLEVINHERMINHLILPHDLKQEQKTGIIVMVLKVLKVAHNQFTLEWQ